jgi:ADP-heptose:LPS heptosyltransferase
VSRSLSKASHRRPWPTRAIDLILRWAAPAALRTRSTGGELPSSKEPPRRLLIVKVFGMGDSVLMRALIELIQRIHPEVELGVLVGPATRELMTTGLAVRVHEYDQKKVTPSYMFSAWRDIRSGHYEAIANFEQGSLAGTAFLASMGARAHVGFASSADDAKCWFLSHPLKFRQSDSMWRSFLRLAQLLYPDLPDVLPSIDLPGSPEARSWVSRWWSRSVGERRSVIAMHLGSAPAMEFRRWPLERFVALADRITARWGDPVIVLTGTAVERELIGEFIKRFRGTAVDASDLGSLEKTMLVLKRCQLLVSNDTGVMHLGAAVGTPTVGLFGPNSPDHWAPLGKCATYVRETSLPCSPCLNNYLNKMPYECTYRVTGQCMADITVGSVEAAIARLFGRELQVLQAQ